MPAKERKRIFVIIEDAPLGTMTRRRLVRSATQPSITPPHQSIIGPFRTRRGAMYAIKHAEVTTVADAERLSQQEKKLSQSRNGFLFGVRKLMQTYGIDQLTTWPNGASMVAFDRNGKGLFCVDQLFQLKEINLRDFDIF
jgi:hypothetical protein